MNRKHSIHTGMAAASFDTPASSASSTSPPPNTNANCSMDESTPPATHHAMDSTNVERDDEPFAAHSTSATLTSSLFTSITPSTSADAAVDVSPPASRSKPALEDIANPAHASRTPATDPTISWVDMSPASRARTRGRRVPMHTIWAMTMEVPSAMPTLLMA